MKALLGTPGGTELLNALADRTRRRVVSTLEDDGASTTEAALAAALARGDETDEEEEEEEVRVALRHLHLPALADAGVVSWDRSAGTVALADERLLEDPAFRRVLETETEDWSAVLECFAHPRRHAVLQALAAADGPLSRSALAAELSRSGSADEDGAGPDEAVVVSLYHRDLPKLEAAGLVEYDRDAGTVAFRGHPALDEEWLEVDLADGADPVISTGD